MSRYLFFLRKNELSSRVTSCIHNISHFSETKEVFITNNELLRASSKIKLVDRNLDLNTILDQVDIVVIVTRQRFGLLNRALDALLKDKIVFLPYVTHKAFTLIYKSERCISDHSLKDLEDKIAHVDSYLRLDVRDRENLVEQREKLESRNMIYLKFLLDEAFSKK